MPDTDVIEAVRRNLERYLSPDVVNELRCADPSGSEDLVSGLVEAFAERELASEIVSYRRNVTGIDHTSSFRREGWCVRDRVSGSLSIRLTL